MKMIDI